MREHRWTMRGFSNVVQQVSRLFGRDRERLKLTAILDAACGGTGGLALLSGEAGLGKTSLVLETGQRAQELEMRVATGSGYDLSTTPPYGPWIEILQEALDLDQQIPIDISNRSEPWTSASQEELFQRTREVLHKAATVDPLLIILDDAHWADQASLDLLRFLARTLHQAPVALVVSYRSDEISRHHPLYALIPTLCREAQVTRLDLRPLGESSIREWIGEVYALSKPEEDRLARYLTDNAEGNPFFASEILRTLEEDRVLTPGEDGWSLRRLPQLTVPSLLQQVIDVRVSRLSSTGQNLLTTASVIGHEVSLELWQQVTNEGEEVLIEVVEEATEIRLVTPNADGRKFTFRHSMFREILYQSISPPRRRLIHQQVATLLATDPLADPDIIAHHFHSADDERAVAWLVQAAERAWRSWAWTEAADRLQRAVDMLSSQPLRDVERAWLLIRLAEARRYNAPRRAREHVDEAEQIAAKAGDVVLSTAVRWVRGRIKVATDENGLPDLEAAVAAMKTFDVDGKKRFLEHTGFRVDSAPAIFAVWLAILGRYTEAIEASDDYFETVADDQRLPLIDAEAHLAQGIANAALGQPERSSAAFQAALSIYLRHGDNLSVGHTSYLFLIETILPYAPDDLPLRAQVAEIGDRAWNQANEINITRAPIVSPPLLFLEGRWDELRAVVGRTVGLRNYVRIWTASYGAAVARERGDPEMAHAYVQAGLPPDPSFREGSVWISCSIQSIRLAADLALDADDADDAERWITIHKDLLTATGRVTGRAEGALLRSRLSLARGLPSAALEHARQALEFATNPRQPLAQIRAQRMLGDISLVLGDPETAACHLAAALDLSRSCTAVYEEAMTKAIAGRHALIIGKTARAMNLLDEAAEVASRLNAQPLLDQIEYERESSRVVDEYPDNLTMREVEVLRFVTEGNTDTQIAESLSISPRTVMTHVSNILGKTGAPSRAAAAAYAVRRGLA